MSILLPTVFNTGSTVNTEQMNSPRHVPASAIHDAHRYAIEVKQLLTTLELPDVGSIAQKKEVVLRAAEQLIRTAEEPVRIGVVGEFGAGKSLLLGALIERADLLPVSEIPTTGNVTALKLKQAAEGVSASEIGDLQIEYLDRHGVMECYEHFLRKATVRIRATELSKKHLRQFAKLETAAQDFQQQVIDCCRACWEDTQDPAQRHFLKELVDFTRTDMALGPTLYGRCVKVSHEVARNGLQLPRMTQDISSMRFADLTVAPSAVFSPDPSAEQLGEAFLLVNRCEITVFVPRHAWELTSDFVLLDFPGLGAGTSGVRDRYLCQRELKDVQTILVLLNGQRPGAGGVNEFYQMMQQERAGNIADCFLTAISRFDQLPVDEQAATFLDKLPLTAPITDHEIFEQVPALDTLIKSAQAFTKNSDRIILLSPLRGLQVLHEKSATHSEAVDPRIEANRHSINESVSRWNKVATSLSDASILRKWLTDFTKDGSLQSLRGVLEHHAANHGIKQLSQRASNLGVGLSREVEGLCLLLERNQHRSVADSPREIIIHALNRLVGKFASLSHVLREEARELKIDGTYLHEMIHERSVIEVGKWKEWSLLLNSSEDGFIAPPRPKNRSLLTGRRKDNSNLPISSSDFESSYLLSCSRLADYTSSKAREALEQWMAEFSTVIDESELTQELRRYASIARQEADEEHADDIEMLEVALDLRKKGLIDRLLEDCRKAASIGDPEEQKEYWRSQFPMSLGRALPWSPDLASETQRQARHQVHLRQFNQQFVEALSRQFSEICGRINQSAIDSLIDTFIELSGEIRHLSEDRAFVGFLSGDTGDTEGIGAASGDVASSLRSIDAYSY
ncbi:MAG: hypothetical protein ACI9R3_003350 [Verrucomicrobiales bacterium]|jgi:hypothetical protein